jgi:hypothetical protein
MAASAGAFRAERRRFRRVASRPLSTELSHTSDKVQVLNISEQGVLLLATRALARGSRRRLRLVFDGTPIAADIVVNRSNRLGSSRAEARYHVAATFVEWLAGRDQLLEGLARR